MHTFELTHQYGSVKIFKFIMRMQIQGVYLEIRFLHHCIIKPRQKLPIKMIHNISQQLCGHPFLKKKHILYYKTDAKRGKCPLL